MEPECSPGTFDRSFASVLQHLVRGLHIDPSQALVVSDETTDSTPASGKNNKKDSNSPTRALRFPRVLPTRAMIEIRRLPRSCTGLEKLVAGGQARNP